MKYAVRVSTIESGWVVVYRGTKDACQEEYENQLEIDREDGTTNFMTQVIDENENVIVEHEGDDYYTRQ